jgi:hypothetical protein
MATAERVEKPTRQIDFQDLIVIKILNISKYLGFPAHKLTLGFQTSRTEADGTTIQQIKPFVLEPVKEADLKMGAEKQFLLHNPNNETEECAYLISLANKDYGDGESAHNIVVSKIPSPNKFQNKRDWVEKSVNKVIDPWNLKQFQSEESKFPTVFISMFYQTLTIAYKGEDDVILREIYNILPYKSE